MTSDAAGLLRNAELRVTRPRLAVLAAVAEYPHADTNTIVGVVRQSLPEVSRQAVYDVANRQLNDFATDGSWYIRHLNHETRDMSWRGLGSDCTFYSIR